MFYTVESDYNDTNFTPDEKQLSIYRLEVLLSLWLYPYQAIELRKVTERNLPLTSTPRAASGKGKRGKTYETKPV